MRHFRLGHPAAETKTVARTAVTGQQIVEDSFYAQRDELSRLTKDGIVDFNGLTPTGKQAALSLQQESRVRLVEHDGRVVVERAKPNMFLRALTAGLAS